MKNRKLSTFAALINRISALTKLFSARKTQKITSNLLMITAMTVLLSLTGGLACAVDSGPMTPEYAARKENFRKQNMQRITNNQRKTAAEALKSERLRVYKTKQDVRHSKPVKFDNK